MKDITLIKKQEQKPISQRIFLKIKIKNLSSKCTKPYCERFVHNISNFDEDNILTEKSILREVNHSRNFHFGKEKNNSSFEQQKKLINQDLSEFNINTKLITKTLKTGLTKSELNDAKKDLNFYLPDVRLKNLKLFRNESLSSVLNSEEAKNSGEKNDESDFYINDNNNITGEKILNLETEKISSRLSQNRDEASIEAKLKRFNNKIKSGIMLNKEREMQLKKIRDNRTKNMFNIERQAVKEVKEYININGFGYGKYFDKKNNANLNLNDINSINNDKSTSISRNKRVEGDSKISKSEFLNKIPVKLPKIISRNMNTEKRDIRDNKRGKSVDKKDSRLKETKYIELIKNKIKEKKNEENYINRMNQKIKLIYLSKMSNNQ